MSLICLASTSLPPSLQNRTCPMQSFIQLLLQLVSFPLQLISVSLHCIPFPLQLISFPLQLISFPLDLIPFLLYLIPFSPNSGVLLLQLTACVLRLLQLLAKRVALLLNLLKLGSCIHPTPPQTRAAKQEKRVKRGRRAR